MTGAKILPPDATHERKRIRSEALLEFRMIGNGDLAVWSSQRWNEEVQNSARGHVPPMRCRGYVERSVCAAVRPRPTGTAPPSSSHRCISGRGSLWRSRSLRRSSDVPRITAPIDNSPIAQFIKASLASPSLQADEHQSFLSGTGDIQSRGGPAVQWRMRRRTSSSAASPQSDSKTRKQWHTR